MEEEHKKPLGRAALVSTLLLGVLLVTAFIPAKWVGIRPTVSSYTPIDFNSIKPAEEVLKESDKDNNGTVTWRELFEANLPEGEALTLEASTPDPKIQKALEDKNNLTASFSKNLMVSSAYLKNNNITDPEAQKVVLSGITQEEVTKATSKTYSIQDIVILTSESATVKKTYGNSLGRVFSDLVTEKELSEHLPGVAAYLETTNTENLEPLKKGVVKVNSAIEKLLAMQVPSSAVIYHIKALNTLQEYKDTLHALSVSDEDPVRSAIFIQKYPEVLKATLSFHKTFSLYFTTNNISFSKNEPGYFFISNYIIK